MTASQGYSTLVSTKIRQEGAVFVATSSDLAGLLVVSKDKDELEKTLIPQAIADLYRACGVDMVVTQIDPQTEQERWVATPRSVIGATADTPSSC